MFAAPRRDAGCVGSLAAGADPAERVTGVAESHESLPEIWTAVIVNSHGRNFYAARTEEAVRQRVLEYVRTRWEETVRKPMPDDPNEAIRMYFYHSCDVCFMGKAEICG